MSASRTLLRQMTKRRVTLPDGQTVTADAPARPLRTKPGTFERRVKTLTGYGAAVERTFHATKGHRSRRVSSEETA